MRTDAKMMKAVILAGGLGTRLRPFTQVIPKPLLPIGEQSLLDIQIDKLCSHNFREIFIATNYKSQYIERFIGSGERFHAKVIYSREDKPLGTCGPLSLLRHCLDTPFIVMNGDILTTMNFKTFYQFGLQQNADLTVATKQIRTPFNFGSVKTRGDLLVHVEEKPDFITEVLAGIYFMRPALLKLVPDDTYFGMNTLIENMLTGNRPVARFLVSDYWLDIGQIDDFRQAEEAYQRHF